jgi:ornithine cyclodeaminase
MIIHVDEAQVRERLPMALAIEVVERALRDRAEGRAHDLPRHAMRYPHGALRVLSATAPELGWVSCKATYSTGATSGRGYVHLIDAITGELRATVDSVHLSRMRTGAATAIATRLLARSDASMHAVIGAGSQALAQIEAVAAVRAIRTVRVWSRDTARLRDFCAHARDSIGLPVAAAASARDAVRGADIVTLITAAREPPIDGAWLERGQHVNAAGSNALDRRELDEAAIEQVNRIVVDARDVARQECGDLLPLVRRGTLSWDDMPELGEVLTKRAAGRVTRDEITLYESHGMGVQDLYAAHAVLADGR